MQADIEQRYVKTLPVMLGAAALLVISLLLSFAVYRNKLARPEGGPLYDSAFIMVFERSKCWSCDQFRATIGKEYAAGPYADRVSLRYYDVSDGQPPARYKLAKPVPGWPTIVVFDVYGREERRYEGLPSAVETIEKFAFYADKRAVYETTRVKR